MASAIRRFNRLKICIYTQQHKVNMSDVSEHIYLCLIAMSPKISHLFFKPCIIPMYVYLQSQPRDDTRKTIATVAGAVVGGAGGGVATGALITGTAVATVAAAPVVIIGSGVVAGAAGLGWLARKIFS